MLVDSMADTSRQINSRISISVFDKLESEAQKKGLTITTLACKILEEHADKKALKEERGDIIVGKQILRYLLQNNIAKQDNLKSNAERAANEILTEWKLQTNNLTLKEFDKRILEWHNLNHLRIRSFCNNEHVRYVVKHNLGSYWSEFQCIMYCKILESLGKVIISSDFNDLSYTIDVPHQKNSQI